MFFHWTLQNLLLGRRVLKVATRKYQINQTQKKGGETKKKKDEQDPEGRASRENCVKSTTGNELAPASAGTSTQSRPPLTVLRKPTSQKLLLSLLPTFQIFYLQSSNWGYMEMPKKYEDNGFK